MKISNEAKVGAIAVVSILLLILGFSFLKGKKLWGDSTTLYANYGNVQGLQKSNAVIINGLQIGTVFDIRADKHMRNILVELTLNKDVSIPANSICVIKSNPISTPSLEIKLGDASTFLGNKDTILTEKSAGMFDNVLKNVDPVLFEVKRAIKSIDTLLYSFNTMLDPRAKNNIAASLENLNAVTASMVQSTASLQILLNTQTGSLAKTLNNMSSVTGNLAATNGQVSNVVSNLDKTTTKIAALEFDKTLNELNATITEMKSIVGKINSSDGTLGKLMNDPVMYQNLASTGNKLNLLPAR
ncbi:MAG: MCE family protein [Chitinophagaceae bacterium]|nr:MAG: MCE family protein [Chitinophagaceae bacterium]